MNSRAITQYQVWNMEANPIKTLYTITAISTAVVPIEKRFGSALILRYSRVLRKPKSNG
jgi:hypothetical protein